MAIFEIKGPDGKVYEVQADTPEQAAKAFAPQQNPAEGQMRSLTDQAVAAFNSGNDAEGQRLLAEASRVSVDGGIAPEGYAVNPEGRMEDLRSPANPNIPTGTAASLGVGALQGLSFGGGDEVVAGARAATGGDYDYDLARMRETERRAQEDNPLAYYGGLIPGAVASSVGAGKALGVNPTGNSLLDTMARGAGIGAGEGTVWGALSGEGGPIARGVNAVKNAALGGVMGGAAPAIVSLGAAGVRKLGDILGGGVDAAIGRANTNRANRAIMETLRKGGVSVDDVADDVARAANQGQPEYRLMDAAGKAGQRRASGIVRSGGDGAEELANFLETRQLGQPERVGAFVDDAFGTRGTTAAKTVGELTDARGAAADAAYAIAREGAGPVDLTPAIGTIDDLLKRDPILGDFPLSQGPYGARLAALKARMTNGKSQLIDFDTVLQLKKDLFKLKGTKQWDDVRAVYGEIDKALESASEGYRAANDGFREASKVIGAVDEGAEMTRPSVRAADSVPRFQGMTPEQQNAARIGYGDRALAKIEANAAPTANRARMFSSPKVSAEADAMALDPQLFRDRLARENVMWETQNRALGGSRTADNLSDVAGVGVAADGFRAVKDALMGRIGSAVGAVGDMAGNALTGQNEATRTVIARILMSDDPRKALASALRQEATAQGRMRVIEALTRATGRAALPTP